MNGHNEIIIEEFEQDEIVSVNQEEVVSLWSE